MIRRDGHMVGFEDPWRLSIVVELQSLRRIQSMSIREVTNGTFNQHKKKKENLRRSEERRARIARLEKKERNWIKRVWYSKIRQFSCMLITMLCRLKKENIILFWYVVIDEDEGTVVFYGENCCEDFLDYLDELAVNEDGFEQSMVMLLFHNLKGYDGMFVF